MSLIIETGANVAGANSYSTASFATTYLTSIGKGTDWSSTATLQEASLVRSCYFMETLDWIGLKTYSTQPLEWPRRNITDKNGYYISATCIPLQLKWVQCELAIRFLNGNDPLPDQDTTGNIIREKVDVIEIEYERGGASQVPYQPFVDQLLKPWLKSRANIELVRV